MRAPHRHPLLLLFAVCVFVLAVGCASARPDLDQADDLVITVLNDLTPPTPVDVFITPADGEPQPLGTVDAAGRRALTFDAAIVATEYRLLARTEAGDTLSSPSFFLERPALIEWELAANTLDVIQ